MQEDIRLCKDCKFMNKNYLHASECIREPVEIDPVDGTLFYLSCLQARRLQFGCGRLGKYFEIKNAKPVGPSNQVIASLWSNI